MMKWLPLWLVDKILLVLAWFVLGSTEKYGLRRPSVGPLQLKNTQGRTPVLDVGALAKVKSGDIKVVPGIKRFSAAKVELVDGQVLDIDSVILATGYRSNVPQWLQVKIHSPKLICKTAQKCSWRLIDRSKFVSFCRDVISFPRTGSQRHHSQMGGKESADCTLSVSPGEDSPELPPTR